MIEAVDRERIEIGKKLGIKVGSLKSEYILFYGAKGKKLYETTSNYYAFQVQGVPTSLEDHYVTEDVPFGLVLFTLLGEQLEISVDISRAMANIGCAVTSRNFWEEGMNMEKTGLKGMSSEEIKAYIRG